jgi:Dual OB-containing domain
MGYTKTIVCLANSYKRPNGRCVAGKEILEGGYGDWIRPVSDRPTAELSLPEYAYAKWEIPKLLDLIEVPFLRAAPHDHQVENLVIDASRSWTKKGKCSWDELDLLCDHPETIWINSDKTTTGRYNCMSPEEAATLENSLLLIKQKAFTIAVEPKFPTGKLACRGKFNYNGVHYNFSLTDPVACVAFERKGEGEYQLDNVYLCLSLTEQFKDGRCHKLVAAVIADRKF